jgi:hypothetical protein
MKKYKILKRGIPMRHGHIAREGFIVNQDGIEYYLLKHIGYSLGKYKYNALWRDNYFGDLNLSGGCIYVDPDDIVCYGKIVNEDGSERKSCWVNAYVFDMND